MRKYRYSKQVQAEEGITSLLDSKTLNSILNEKCQSHKKFYCDLIFLNPKVIRICRKCQVDLEISDDEIIPFKDLLSSSPSSWPELFPLVKKICDIKIDEQSTEFIIKETSKFFKELRMHINDSIDKAEANTQKQILKLKEESKNYSNKFSNQQPINNFQLAMESEDVDIDEALQQFLESYLIKSEPIKQNEQESKAEEAPQINQNSFSMESSLGVISKIAKTVENINFFLRRDYECIPQYKLNKSAILEIIKKNNKITITNESYTWTQCYLTLPIEIDKKYIIRFSFHNDFKHARPRFRFGLIKQKNEEFEWIGNATGINYQEKDGGNCYLVKGKKLHAKEDNIIEEIKNFEVRIDHQSKLFRVASYPQYENIMECISNGEFGNDSLFAIGLGDPSSVVIEDAIEVQEFDSKMD